MDVFGIVTPLAGVWIEITGYDENAEKGESLPSRECGLKYMMDDGMDEYDMVTPLAGVWIEILRLSVVRKTIESLPSRECGLKSLIHVIISEVAESLPSRECGLKFDLWQRIKSDVCHSPRGSVD